MVKLIKKNGESYFLCEECKLGYKEEQWAERCEKWCKEYHSCNLDITKHAIKKKLRMH